MNHIRVTSTSIRSPWKACVQGRAARVTIIGLLCFCFALCFAAAAARAAAFPEEASPNLSSERMQQLFVEGNERFREGLERHAKEPEAAKSSFSAAAAAWRTIVIDGDVRNAQLETNLANASLLAGDVPHAIAAFRRAQSIDPRNSTIRQGLAAARRAAGTEALAPGASPPPAKAGTDGGFTGTLRRIGGFLEWAADRTFERLAPRLLLASAAIGYIGAFGLLAARLLGARRVRPSWPVAMAILSLLAAGPLVAHESASRASPAAVLVQSGVTARNGPADMYEASFKEPLAPGLEVTIIERRSEWTQVRLVDGRSCWVPASSLESL